ncbi:hypothetical protein [Actinomadura citrea]|uniref:Uncharacterized protein n=1 Tax=Actinomadura citrea TaxID=46158 RepID=A0A7Y9GB48_9ACTN|nr:hypothetical protein [Actinomadura citrea]NYE13233.1 hypothetical protein [Actinomadura citrea]GGU04930.1 hypothetical protein GCM10010177_75350 [Actinomadura citrea]
MLIRRFFARRKHRARPATAEASVCQKVIAFSGLGRLGVGAARLWRELRDGEGPEAYL